MCIDTHFLLLLLQSSHIVHSPITLTHTHNTYEPKMHHTVWCFECTGTIEQWTGQTREKKKTPTCHKFAANNNKNNKNKSQYCWKNAYQCTWAHILCIESRWPNVEHRLIKCSINAQCNQIGCWSFSCFSKAINLIL